MYDIQHCFVCRPSDSTVSEDAEIEPRTVMTTALAVRCSNHSARSTMLVPDTESVTHHFLPSHKILKVHNHENAFFKGGFFGFFLFMYDIQHCFICRPSDFTVSEDAGIESRTVATTALAVRRSNHSARSHPHENAGPVF
jgi:hypothetical protein